MMLRCISGKHIIRSGSGYYLVTGLGVKLSDYDISSQVLRLVVTFQTLLPLRFVFFLGWSGRVHY
jgi:hypothetical protein